MSKQNNDGSNSKIQPENRISVDEILDSVLVGMYCTNPDGDFVPLDDSKNLLRAEAKQAILDWHNKQVEELLDRLTTKRVRLCDNAASDKAPTFVVAVKLSAIEAERNKLKESSDA